MSKARRQVVKVMLKWEEEGNSMRAYWSVSCFDCEGKAVSVPGLGSALGKYNLLEFPFAADAVRVFFPHAKVEEVPFDFGPVQVGSMVGR